VAPFVRSRSHSAFSLCPDSDGLWFVVNAGYTDEFAFVGSRRELGASACIIDLYEQRLLIDSLSARLAAFDVWAGDGIVVDALNTAKTEIADHFVEFKTVVEQKLEGVGSTVAVLQELFAHRLDAVNVMFMEHVKCVRKDWDPACALKLSFSQLSYICQNIQIFADGVHKYLLDFVEKRCKELELGILCKLTQFNLEEHQQKLAALGRSLIQDFAAAAKQQMEALRKPTDGSDGEEEDINYDSLLYPTAVVEKSPLHAVLKNEAHARKREDDDKLEARQRLLRQQQQEKAKRAKELELERKKARKRLREIEAEQAQLYLEEKQTDLGQSKDT